MSKRKGRKPLDLDNLDDDSEPEEAGTMVRAEEEVVRNRVMKVAKRRLQKQPNVSFLFVRSKWCH